MTKPEGSTRLRQSYDAVAEPYGERFFDELRHKAYLAVEHPSRRGYLLARKLR